MFGPFHEKMLKTERDDHLGYKKHDHTEKSKKNRRNGSSKKAVR